MTLSLWDHPFAITDIETTGDIFGYHEILEIGLVLCDPLTFDILDTYEAKIKPLHIEHSIDKALERNGYTPEDWVHAETLETVLKQYAEKTKHSFFCSYNVSFDWGFMNNGFKQTNISHTIDYHHIDIMSLALMKYRKNLPNLSSNLISEKLDIPKEPLPHRALAGAMQSYHSMKKLLLPHTK
jgi:DNA polymerase-3 subunit alpha (Gram-positive type)